MIWILNIQTQYILCNQTINRLLTHLTTIITGFHLYSTKNVPIEIVIHHQANHFSAQTSFKFYFYVIVKYLPSLYTTYIYNMPWCIQTHLMLLVFFIFIFVVVVCGSINYIIIQREIPTKPILIHTFSTYILYIHNTIIHIYRSIIECLYVYVINKMYLHTYRYI